MSKSSSISMSVIRRMPRYYRFLDELAEKGVVRVSSSELSALLGLTASQIRQDLNCFGGFGQQGYGYPVTQLRDEIAKILGLHIISDAILIGAGNMGLALANHLDFLQRGIRLTAIFDISPDVVGRDVRGLIVRHTDELETFCRSTHPQMAILSIPQSAAPDVVHNLTKLGVRSFWNFSHYDIPSENHHVIVENVHLGDSLMTLSYRMKHEKTDSEND